MRLVRLKQQDKDYAKIISLYERSFPAEEKIPQETIHTMIDLDKIEMFGLYANDELVGLAFTAEYKQVVTILYYAIMEEFRKNGYGSRRLKVIQEVYAGYRIVLNIEPIDQAAANYPIRVKRKQFYLSNGFEDLGYLSVEMGVSYEMLAWGGYVSREEYEAIIYSIAGKYAKRIFNH